MQAFREAKDDFAAKLEGILKQKEGTIKELQKQVDMLRSVKSPRRHIKTEVMSPTSNVSFCQSFKSIHILYKNNYLLKWTSGNEFC